MNADGSGKTNLTNHPFDDYAPAWSPDGSRIVFYTQRDGTSEIYVMNADGSNQTNLTNHPRWDYDAVWSPDGSKIAFNSGRDGASEVYVMNADGSNQTRLTNNTTHNYGPAWSPDGTKIAFSSRRNSSWDIYVMNANGSNQIRLTTHSADDHNPTWSPDGAKIAFDSRRDGGSAEIYVMNADGSSQTRLVSLAGDDYAPAWSPDGTRVVFWNDQSPNREIYVVNVDGSGLTNLTNSSVADYDPDWQPLPPTGHVLLLSATSSGSVGGVTFGVEDILRYDSSTGSWSLYFDGSNVGFSKAAASFALKNDGSLLLTPAANVNLPGVGTVTPWDVVRFAPTSMGNNTAGTFHWYIDGSDIGLTAAAEKIDALDVLPDGRVLVSTTGTLAVPKPGGGTLKSQDEDLTAFTPTATGAATSGSWAPYFNGTAVTGLGAEDVTGAAVDPATGDIYLVLQNGFNLSGVSGGPKDILRLRPSGGGNYTPERFWRGPDHGLNLNLAGIEVEN